ncbi:MAG: hypothetical protein FWD57_02855, partial [Polyangiaceae bacterium]|nr:hypothetical protein [Polyangiaceae bacterium]
TGAFVRISASVPVVAEQLFKYKLQSSRDYVNWEHVQGSMRVARCIKDPVEGTTAHMCQTTGYYKQDSIKSPVVVFRFVVDEPNMLVSSSADAIMEASILSHATEVSFGTILA